MRNRTLIQFFEWYLPANCSFWKEVKNKAKSLAELGLSEVWLPPAYKCADGINDVGYGVYDMYDLGEFNQKGSVPTKYGTIDEYKSAIKELQRNGMKVYADIVFNHRIGADETENVRAKIYDEFDRHRVIGECEISAWTKFTFSGRNGKYSDFVWNYTHFDGCDWDDRTKKKALYLFEGKNWDSQVDTQNHNYDYLMGSDLDFDNPETFEELLRWGKWYLDMTSVDGFRIDAVKHISFKKIFKWVMEMCDYSGRDLFAVGEYWNSSTETLINYLDRTAHSMHLFDVPLHYNFHKVSISNSGFDMRKIFDNTLVKNRPQKSVTIVDNHDTQPGQALQSFVASWFKLHAYSLILLRQEGLPCVFYGDLYGIPNNNIKPIEKLQTLIKARYELAYGEQVDYFYNENVVGFTRLGEDKYKFSGLAVVMTDGGAGAIQMCMGKRFIGKTMVDCLENCDAKIIVGDDGCAVFPVNGGSVSVYVEEGCLELN